MKRKQELGDDKSLSKRLSRISSISPHYSISDAASERCSVFSNASSRRTRSFVIDSFMQRNMSKIDEFLEGDRALPLRPFQVNTANLSFMGGKKKPIASGSFGNIFRMQYHRQSCAAKVLSSISDESLNAFAMTLAARE